MQWLSSRTQACSASGWSILWSKETKITKKTTKIFIIPNASLPGSNHQTILSAKPRPFNTNNVWYIFLFPCNANWTFIKLICRYFTGNKILASAILARGWVWLKLTVHDRILSSSRYVRILLGLGHVTVLLWRILSPSSPFDSIFA